MGLDVKFLEGEGPVFGNPIKTAKDVINIEPFDSEKLSYVYKAVENIRRSLPRNIPLIGFCGSPWTLAAYSIEGRSSKDFLFTRNFLKENNVEAHIFLDSLTKACFEYLKKQVEAGADVIQIFDSWANLLNEDEYKIYSLEYISVLIGLLKNDIVTKNIPIILFSREPKAQLKTIMTSQTDCLSLYWSMNDIDLNEVRNKVSIQGNLNPEILLESNDVIRKETTKILTKYKDYPGYIFNLGHGITPNINPDKVKFLTDFIRGS
jgi:uroporphyrinogen decarboxylase